MSAELSAETAQWLDRMCEVHNVAPNLGSWMARMHELHGVTPDDVEKELGEVRERLTRLDHEKAKTLLAQAWARMDALFAYPAPEDQCES